MDGPVKTVIISGLELKAKDLTITDNIIWSRNTGRVASGDMEGDIKAKKIKLNLTLAPLDDEEAAAFAVAIEPPFFRSLSEIRSLGKQKRANFMLERQHIRCIHTPIYCPDMLALPQILLKNEVSK